MNIHQNEMQYFTILIKNVNFIRLDYQKKVHTKSNNILKPK